MLHRYLIPRQGTGIIPDFRRPKYIDAFVYSCRVYGLEDIFLVITDLTDDEHTSLLKNPDVIFLPDDPNEVVTKENITALQTLKFPIQSTTSGDVLNELQKYIMVMQIFAGKNVNPLAGKDLTATVDDAAQADLAKGGATAQKGQTLASVIQDLSNNVVVNQFGPTTLK